MPEAVGFCWVFLANSKKKTRRKTETERSDRVFSLNAIFMGTFQKIKADFQSVIVITKSC